MSKQTYINGFCKVAEDAGVNSNSLANYAYSSLKTEKMAQDGAGSTPAQEYLAGAPSRFLLNPLTPYISTAGMIGGLVSTPNSASKSITTAFLPGVSEFREANRLKTQALREEMEAKKIKSNAKPVRHLVSEYLGPSTSVLTGAGLGALAGMAMRGSVGLTMDGVAARKAALTGAGAGAATAVVANLIGAITAAIKRRRTAKEQILNDEDNVLPNYLLPGPAVYDYYKRLGRSQGDREDDVAKKNKGNKKK